MPIRRMIKRLNRSGTQIDLDSIQTVSSGVGIAEIVLTASETETGEPTLHYRRESYEMRRSKTTPGSFDTVHIVREEGEQVDQIRTGLDFAAGIYALGAHRRELAHSHGGVKNYVKGRKFEEDPTLKILTGLLKRQEKVRKGQSREPAV